MKMPGGELTTGRLPIAERTGAQTSGWAANAEWDLEPEVRVCDQGRHSLSWLQFSGGNLTGGLGQWFHLVIGTTLVQVKHFPESPRV